jgi:hypothetical protein
MGEPEYIYPRSSEAGNSSCEERQNTGDERRYAKFLFYLQKGALFVVYDTFGEYDLICPDMLVTSFCYFPQMRLESFLRDQDLSNMCVGKLDSSDLTEWHGFGSGY